MSVIPSAVVQQSHRRKCGNSGCRRHATSRRSLQVRWSLLLLLVICCGSLLELSSAKEKYCGANLDKAIAEICTHGFNSYNMKAAVAPGKRKANDFDAQSDPKLYALESNYLIYPNAEATGPLLASLYGTDRMLQTRRRRGIYEECCLNSCSYGELAAYCLLLRI